MSAYQVSSGQQFKFKHWGHDAVVLHEHDIRKPRGAYAFLQNANRRNEFVADLSALMEAAPFTLVSAVIRKADFGQQYHAPQNPYSIAMEFGLERLFKHLEGLGQGDNLTHVVVERWGKREDTEYDILEKKFRRSPYGEVQGWGLKSFP